MQKFITLVAISLIHLTISQSAFAQITINLPKLPKIVKTKPDPQNKENGNGHGNGNGNGNGKVTNTSSKLVYEPQRPNGTPVLLKNSIYIQAITHNEYWKMPNQRNYSSWVPKLKFSQFYNNDKKLNFTVEYFNPDGSVWYSEQLESGFFAADRTISYSSPSPYGGILDTKSTAGTGLFSFKVTNDDTKEVIYQGKFKVGKFGTSHNPQEKNKVDFFVDHDWLMPMATVGFHHSLSEIGGMPPLVSVWLKGPADAAGLEGRLFFKGQQIASTKDENGGGVSDYDERASGFAAAFAPQNFWKRWQFQWTKFLVDNNGTFNRELFPNTHYADKNPGEYTVKIFQKGTQIRELKFTVGADGRFVQPAYTSQIFMPYYHIVVPTIVTGGTEKWNVTAWKTESLYGNPLTGFALQ